jgi:hypothetical protein
MPLKPITVFAACVLSFGAGVVLSLPRAKAQSNTQQPKRTYIQVAYMKSRPGQDPYKLEHDIWGPVHKQRVQTGRIVSWAMMAPLYAGAKNYDYVTVETFHSLADMENENYDEIFGKVWGKDKMKANMKQTDDTRDMLGSEIYVVVDQVDGK